MQTMLASVQRTDGRSTQTKNGSNGRAARKMNTHAEGHVSPPRGNHGSLRNGQLQSTVISGGPLVPGIGQPPPRCGQASGYIRTAAGHAVAYLNRIRSLTFKREPQ